jgi:hypothetical protein
MKTNYNYKCTEFQNTKYSSNKWWEFVKTMGNQPENNFKLKTQG